VVVLFWLRGVYNHRFAVGAWRRLVAHLLGVQGVASSNLAVPTNFPHLYLVVTRLGLVRLPLPERWQRHHAAFASIQRLWTQDSVADVGSHLNRAVNLLRRVGKRGFVIIGKLIVPIS
jgi:hypothetical protein